MTNSPLGFVVPRVEVDTEGVVLDLALAVKLGCDMTVEHHHDSGEAVADQVINATRAIVRHEAWSRGVWMLLV